MTTRNHLVLVRCSENIATNTYKCYCHSIHQARELFEGCLELCRRPCVQHRDCPCTGTLDPFDIACNLKFNLYIIFYMNMLTLFQATVVSRKFPIRTQQCSYAPDIVCRSDRLSIGSAIQNITYKYSVIMMRNKQKVGKYIYVSGFRIRAFFKAMLHQPTCSVKHFPSWLTYRLGHDPNHRSLCTSKRIR